MSVIVQIKRDTLANFTAQNKVLGVGEIVITIDKKVLKVGDGVKSFNQLNNLLGA